MQTPTQEKRTFTISGMDCANCALTLEKGISQLDGVNSCNLNFTTEKLTIAGEASDASIIERVEQLGYKVKQSPTSKTQNTPAAHPPAFINFMWQRPETRLALLGAILIFPGLILTEILAIHHLLIDITSVIAMLIAGFPIARSAWNALRINHDININVLMTIAAVGAVFIAAYTEAGMVIVLFAISEALEGYTAQRSRDAIRSLIDIVPSQATRLQQDNGHLIEEITSIENLQIGDTILVKPGQQIPMDGMILSGSSSLNQAPITGESRLIPKQAGHTVFASSINGEGSLQIKVTHLAQDNTISRLIKMVEEAQEKRSPTNRFIDRFARYYTPTVVVLALLVALIPPLLFQQPFLNPTPNTFGWLYRALALLVVSCPCALVISTPVSIISAISNAARNGVLIKGGVFIEQLNRLKAIAFDKTGTLTAGKPSVINVRPINACQCQVASNNTNFCKACQDLLALTFAVERQSEHALAAAIRKEAQKHGLQNQYPTAEKVTALTGHGVSGYVEGHQIIIGSHRYFGENKIEHMQEHCQAAKQDALNGFTPILVSQDDQYIGTITIADTIRESSTASLSMLKKLGISTLVMLTGDNIDTARTIAKQVGITDIRADLLPQHKMDAIQNLQQEHHTIAMVGDGINDAPALATADIGIAIGGAGSTAQAMETADIVLMSQDLRQLPFALHLSRSTMKTVYTNIIFAIGIKLAFILLVLLGHGTMWMAVAADMGVSLLVTLNGMRLVKTPKPQHLS